MIATVEIVGTTRCRRLGVIPNRSDAIRKLVKRLGPTAQLRVCYEAGPIGYALYWELTTLGVTCEALRDLVRAREAAISLKKERIKKQISKTRALVLADVADYVETFYNRTRRHSPLGGVSPEQFEAAHKPRRKSVH